jgi:hypothetical protein
MIRLEGVGFQMDCDTGCVGHVWLVVGTTLPEQIYSMTQSSKNAIHR